MTGPDPDQLVGTAAEDTHIPQYSNEFALIEIK